MGAIFLAFANNPENRLPTLAQEDDQVYALLARRAAQQHFTLHRDSATTNPKIAEFLILYRDTLNVFLYSGHAEKDALLLEDDNARAEGIAQLLGQCPNLKLVILNGCSTAGQVEKLIQLPNHPIVIATSAAVDDFAATQFSIRFFQTLSEQYDSIENAFQMGLGAAQLTSSAATRAGRQHLNTSDQKEPVWGIYYAPAGALHLSWKLPTFLPPPDTEEEPNLYLIRTILEALAPFEPEAKLIHEGEAKGKTFSLKMKRGIILRCFPHPVSEHLRKLFANSQINSDATFYDKLGADRLRQITTTYNTIIELMAFVMLSQLWNALYSNQALNIKEAQRLILKQFFTLSEQERAVYSFFPLIKTIREIFDQNNVEYFVKELDQVSQTFNEQSDFYNACVFLETLKRQFTQQILFEKAEADRLCIIGEMKLSTVLAQLGFMARYTMASIKNINVLKYRHLLNPRYKHLIVELVTDVGELADDVREMQQFLDSSSVLLQRKEQDDIVEFLNLSPFIIDEHAFVEKNTVSKLYFFNHYEKAAKVLRYKFIYRPDKENLLTIQNKGEIVTLKEQFDFLSELLFQTPLHNL